MIAIENRSGKIGNRFSSQNRIPIFPVKSIHVRFLPSIFLSLAGRRQEKFRCTPSLPHTPVHRSPGHLRRRPPHGRPGSARGKQSPLRARLYLFSLNPPGREATIHKNNGIQPGIFRGLPTGKREAIYSNVWRAEARAVWGLGRRGPFSDAGTRVLTPPSLRHPCLCSPKSDRFRQ